MNEYLKNIGRTGEVVANGLIVYVTILDVKQSYGRVRYMVEPVSGRGNVWVEHITIHED